ncbi:MAG: DNA topoisomerase 4 subunit A [Synergistaceae bacterium]|nr:DNA topoisomerase 4 subunit A [Synergistaceae bacterium]
MSEIILETGFDEELKNSYLSYAMSVITERALPDARDGLKPVQRRILHAMKELALSPSGAHKKSARVVGETMGKYHPHGDSSIYEAMARMAQPFSLRVPLVDGQGNFGSLDGDSPAAMRYTEVRLAAEGEMMHADVDEETVDFVPNFDESLEEPSVLPAVLPNLLINGTSGIAVGMATNIPPHNPVETLSLLSEYLGEGCMWSAAEVASRMPGPDFPTGGEIVGRNGVREMYETGRGKFTLRGKTHIEETKNRNLVVITEIPYGATKSRIVKQIADRLDERGVDGVVAVRDESDRSGDRVVVELHRRVDAEAVRALLLSSTQLSGTFGGNMLALVGGAPATMSLKDVFDCFIGHRREVVRRRTEYRLNRAEARLHIVEGLLKALDLLDEIISLIRSSKTTAEARAGLVERLGFSILQAGAILDMRLGKLVGLEREALAREEKQLRKSIAEYRAILGSEKKLDSVVLREFDGLAAHFAKGPLAARRTAILDEEPEAKRGKDSPGQVRLSFEQPGPCVVSIDGEGYIRKRDVRRRPRDEEGSAFITEGLVFAIGDDGRFYSRERAGIPDASTRKLVSATEFFGADEGTSLALISPDMHDSALFVFADGSLKRTSLDAMRGETSRRNTSRYVVAMKDGERLFAAVPLREEVVLDAVLLSKLGRAIRIPAGNVPLKGISSRGVSGMALEEDDSLAAALVIPGADAAPEDLHAVVRASNGLFFRFQLGSLRTSRRGGKGLYVHRGERPSFGEVVQAAALSPGDGLVADDGSILPMEDVGLRKTGEHTLVSMTKLDGVGELRPERGRNGGNGA